MENEENTKLSHKNGIYTIIKINKNIFASGANDNLIKIWDLPSKKCLNILEGHQASVRSLCLVSANVLASSSDDKNIIIWNWKKGKALKTLKGHTDYAKSTTLLNNRFLVSGGYDKNIILWDICKGVPKKIIKSDDDNWIMSICNIGNQNKIAVAQRDLQIIDFNFSEEKIYKIKNNCEINSIAYNQELNIIAVGNDNCSILFISANEYNIVCKFMIGSAYISRVIFFKNESNEMNYLAVGSGNTFLYVVNLSKNDLNDLSNEGILEDNEENYKNHGNTVWALCYMDKYNTLISGSWDKKIKLTKIN